MIPLTIDLGVLALLLIGGYFIFVCPWSAMARDEERVRRKREAGEWKGRFYLRTCGASADRPTTSESTSTAS